MKEINVHNQSALNYSESLSDKLSEMCAPLFINGFTNFSYMKVLDCGYKIHICSNKSWLRFSFEQDLYNNINELYKYVIKSPPSNSIQNALWITLPENPLFSALYDFNIWNGITLFERHETYFEVWGFSTCKDNLQIYEIYREEISMLKRFVFYFKENFVNLINNIDKTQMFILKDNINLMSFSSGNKFRMDFLNKTKINKFYLNSAKNNCYLTKRELECLFHISSGKSMKETARFLHLSPRTVEQYLNNIKIKLNTTSKSKIIEFFLESSIKDIGSVN